ITMQVARNFFLNREKTLWRKLREMLLAFQIEKKLSKDEILALYLNQNYMGNRAYGVGAAAKTYYGKEVGQLSLAQIAMLAGLYKAPSKFNPVVNPERAKLRRNYVLRRMQEQGYLSPQEVEHARAETLTARIHAPRPMVSASYVAEMVRANLFKTYGESVYTSGLQVTTTIDPDKQQAANAAIRKALLAYDQRHGYRGAEKHYDLASASQKKRAALLENHPAFGGLKAALVTSVDARHAVLYLGPDEADVTLGLAEMAWARPYISEDKRGPKPRKVNQVVQPGDIVRIVRTEKGWRLSQLPLVGGALVSLSPKDGSIRALVGGFDYFYSRFNRAIQAIRQPGSAFKPFIYSAALAKGFTPASVFNDAPVVDDTLIAGEMKTWRPENYSGRFYGPTRMRLALAKSRNLVSIRILRKVGIRYTLKHIKKFAMSSREMPADLSLSLGTLGLSPLELASGYAVLANQGYRVEPYLIQQIRDRDGQLIYEHFPEVACNKDCASLISPEALNENPRQSRQGKRLGIPATRVLARENAYQVTSMMQDVIRMGTGTRALKLGRKDLAGKTGTTNDQKDAWFSGFNHDLVTTVWIGFDQLKPLGRKETGGKLALPAWVDYMKVALQHSPDRQWKAPPGMVSVKIDAETGLKAGAGTRKFAFEVFRSGHVPDEDLATLAPIKGVEVPEQIF
ncbi:MAG TPA: PBP1A family penicillin-binding protein, partial [Gammaproteobacteria bacterium]|nr:PBP1A family penicillin-binding protein [Gammaproteobacteria bacterium]